jgi:hypothetical protein
MYKTFKSSFYQIPEARFRFYLCAFVPGGLTPEGAQAPRVLSSTWPWTTATSKCPPRASTSRITMTNGPSARSPRSRESPISLLTRGSTHFGKLLLRKPPPNQLPAALGGHAWRGRKPARQPIQQFFCAFTIQRMHTQSTGSRAQVWHGTAKKTSGGLTKGDLMMSRGRIVSRKKHLSGKKSIHRLTDLGYIAKKGEFVIFRKHHRRKPSSMYTLRKSRRRK